MKNILSERIMPAISIALYAAALSAPALTLKNTVSPTIYHWDGWECALNSIFGVFTGHFEIVANLLWVAAVGAMLFRAFGVSGICSAVALIFASQTMALWFFPVWMDESGTNFGKLVRCEAGFYLWIASMLAVLIPSVRATIAARTGGSHADS